MTCYANPQLQSWHDERLAEIQSLERTCHDHIEGMRLRAEHYPEPYRTEFISHANLFENVVEWVKQRDA